MSTRKSTPASTGDLYTLEEVARLVNASLGVTRYAIKSRRIPPTKRVGLSIRLFDAAAVELIKAAVAETQAYRTPLGKSAARLMK